MKKASPARATTRNLRSLRKNRALRFESLDRRLMMASLVADIAPSVRDAIAPKANWKSPPLVEMNGDLYYLAIEEGINYGKTSPDLWRLRTGDAKPTKVAELNSNAYAGADWLTPINGDLYFTQGVTREIGVELYRWRSDLGSVELVSDIYQGKDNNSSPTQLTNVNGTLYFVASDSVAGKELWRINGPVAERVADIWPGDLSSGPDKLTAVGDKLFFTARDSSNRLCLWVTDRNSLGVTKLNVFNSEAMVERTVFNEELYFTADAAAADQQFNVELWKSNGSPATLVADINSRGGSYPADLTAVGNSLFFAANRYPEGRELFAYDTIQGVRLVKELPSNPLSVDLSPDNLTNLNGTLFFTATDGSNGANRELWKSNGTANGTVRVKDINSGDFDSDPESLTVVGNWIYFAAADNGPRNTDNRNWELWKSDGVTTTKIEIDSLLTPSLSPISSAPHHLTNFAGTLYFVASHSDWGSELWRDDGIVGVAPTEITLAPLATSPTPAVGTAVARLSAIDPDTDDFVTYCLASGDGDTSNLAFSINGNNLVCENQLARQSYSIRLRCTDRHGNSREEPLTFTPGATELPGRDIFVGFGGASGAWMYNEISQWRFLHPQSPACASVGDFDGNGQTDVMLSFSSGGGTWIFANGSTWQYVHPGTAQHLVAADVNGDGRDEIVLDLGASGGIWEYLPATRGWKYLHGGTTNGMTRADVDGNGQDDVAISLPGGGLWLYSNNATWQFLHQTNPTTMAGGDLDGNGHDDLALSFPGGGTWTYSVGGHWGFIHQATALNAAIGDVNGDGKGEALFNLGTGNGTWEYLADTRGWKFLHSQGASLLACADVDGNGRADVVLGFGPSTGMWVYKNNATWQYLHGSVPAGLATANGYVGSNAIGLLDTADAALAIAPSLVANEVQPIIREAIAHWNAQGASNDVLAALAHDEATIVDLPGTYLGLDTNGCLFLDIDAAGRGWFIDPTPSVDEESTRLAVSSQLKATDSRAVDRIDLLTVVEHELGLIAGLQDVDAVLESLMSGSLGTGIRIAIHKAPVDSVFANKRW